MEKNLEAGDRVEILSYGRTVHRGTVVSRHWESDAWFRSRGGTVVIAPYDTETLTVDVRNLGPRQFYRRASACTQTQDWRSGTPNQSRIAYFTIRHEASTPTKITERDRAWRRDYFKRLDDEQREPT